MVYEGLHTVINKRVAIKVIKAEYAGDQLLVRRVLAEAHAVNAVRHRGIVDIHAHGLTPDGRPYLVMELLHGETLHDLLSRQGQLSRGEALQILLEATGPLFAAHKAGIIHRDLKPSNLFLCRDDDGERFLKLLDFGLAKRSAPGATSSTMTSASLIVGTPDYMAPEQARAQSTDARTDIYALGVMAFELLSGQLPYAADNSVDLVMQHLTAPVPKLEYVDPTISQELSNLVSQMMDKDPALRPQTLEPIRAVLKRLVGRPSGPISTAPQTATVIPRPSLIQAATLARAENTQVRPRVSPPRVVAARSASREGPIPTLPAAEAVPRQSTQRELAPVFSPDESVAKTLIGSIDDDAAETMRSLRQQVKVAAAEASATAGTQPAVDGTATLLQEPIHLDDEAARKTLGDALLMPRTSRIPVVVGLVCIVLISAVAAFVFMSSRSAATSETVEAVPEVGPKADSVAAPKSIEALEPVRAVPLGDSVPEPAVRPAPSNAPTGNH